MNEMIPLLLGFDISLGTWWNLGLGLGTLLAGATCSFAFKRFKTWAAKKKAKLGSDTCTHSDKSMKLLNGGQKHAEINGVLAELRTVLDAKVAYVGQYHNGGNFLDGSSVKRYSVSHESCAPGIGRTALPMQNVLISLFWDIVPFLQENKTTGRLVSELQDSYLKSTLVDDGDYAFALLPLRKWCRKNRQLQLIGYIYVSWGDKESYEGKPEAYIGTQLTNARRVIENQLLSDSG